MADIPDGTKLSEKDQIIFDCRFNLADPSAGEQAYQAGHIPSAFYLHLDDDLSSPIQADTGRHPLPDIKNFANNMPQITENINPPIKPSIVFLGDTEGNNLFFPKFFPTK